MGVYEIRGCVVCGLPMTTGVLWNDEMRETKHSARSTVAGLLSSMTIRVLDAPRSKRETA